MENKLPHFLHVPTLATGLIDFIVIGPLQKKTIPTYGVCFSPFPFCSPNHSDSGTYYITYPVACRYLPPLLNSFLEVPEEFSLVLRGRRFSFFHFLFSHVHFPNV